MALSNINACEITRVTMSVPYVALQRNSVPFQLLQAWQICLCYSRATASCHISDAGCNGNTNLPAVTGCYLPAVSHCVVHTISSNHNYAFLSAVFGGRFLFVQAAHTHTFCTCTCTHAVQESS